jgi:hypothetical protein
MKMPSLSRVPVVGLCLVSIGVAAALAQTPNGPTPQTPDLLGIYPGMPAAAARAQLQKRIQSYFTDQNPMSQNALLTALREKYGKRR